MPETKIYIEISKEFQQLLVENSLTLEDIIQQQGIDANLQYDTLPDNDEYGSRTRDLVPVILAGSAAVLAVSTAISQLLNTLYAKPYFVEYWAEEELRNGDGDILLDKDGKPQTKFVKKHEIIEPSKSQTAKTLDIAAPRIKFKFNTKSTPIK